MEAAVLVLVEFALWFICLTQKPQTRPRPPAPPDDWTPPSTEEIARVVGWPGTVPADHPGPTTRQVAGAAGWPNTAPADPLWDRELDG